MVTIKIRSRSQKSNKIHKVWPESIIWFKRERADKLFFGSKFDFQSAGVTLKMRSKSPNSISSPCPSGVSLQVWSKSTNWFRRQRADKAHFIFTVFIVWWPWKLGQVHQNLIKSLNHPKITMYEDWSIHHLVQKIGCRQAFWDQNLKFLQSL